MAENDQLLGKIGKLIDPIRQQVYEQGANIVRMMQGQKRLEQRKNEQGSSVEHIKTAVEAIAAGQAEIKETMATKADHLDVSRKINKAINDYGERIEDLEKEAGIPHPHKH